MKTHPLTIINIEEKEVTAFEYAQMCAHTLLNNGLISKMDHKNIIKKVEKWLAKHNLKPVREHK